MSMSTARFGLVSLVVGSMGVAHAGIYTIERAGSGWVRHDGSNNSPEVIGNFVVGNLQFDGEYRNWFSFDLSMITEPIVSAMLRVDSVDVDLDQMTDAVTYDITSYDNALDFNTMGNGVLYGQREYEELDSFMIREIELNAAAVSAMNASDLFLMSGRLSDGASFGSDFEYQYVFGGSGSTPFLIELVVTTVPGPGTFAMAGVVGVGCVGRRRR